MAQFESKYDFGDIVEVDLPNNGLILGKKIKGKVERVSFEEHDQPRYSIAYFVSGGFNALCVPESALKLIGDEGDEDGSS